ncbi:MAG: AraC family transcriptional regulator [Spirochaetes bacterium]|nr:AraC family transcriptional regulator [Spirochaetota bacterium]
MRSKGLADASTLVDSACERLHEGEEEAKQVIKDFSDSLAQLTNRDPLIMKFYYIELCVRFIKSMVSEDSIDVSGFVGETVQQLKRLSDIRPAETIVADFARQVSSSFSNAAPQASFLAKNLLLDPRCRINEVSDAVGYKNYVSFYNVFTKHEGRTPSEYRSGLKGKR